MWLRPFCSASFPLITFWWSRLPIWILYSWVSKFTSEQPLRGLAQGHSRVHANGQAQRQFSVREDRQLLPTINQPQPGHSREVVGPEVKGGESWRSSGWHWQCLQGVKVGTAGSQAGKLSMACLPSAAHSPQPPKYQLPLPPPAHTHTHPSSYLHCQTVCSHSSPLPVIL